MREGGGGGVLGRTYSIQSQTTTTVCIVWMHVANWHTSRCSLAAHSCGDGRSSPLIDVVAGHSWTIVCGGWVLMVVGGRLLPWAGVGMASSSWFVIRHGRRRTHGHGRCSWSVGVVLGCFAL